MILKFLKGYSVKDKIDYIQEMRNTLIEERTAYTEEKNMPGYLLKNIKYIYQNLMKLGIWKAIFLMKK